MPLCLPSTPLPGRQRNRAHAKRSRQRKKSFTESLEKAARNLRRENELLRQHLVASIGVEKLEATMADKKTRSYEHFISSIQKPKNHVVDHATVMFLQSLQQKNKSDSKKDNEEMET